MEEKEDSTRQNIYFLLKPKDDSAELLGCTN